MSPPPLWSASCGRQSSPCPVHAIDAGLESRPANTGRANGDPDKGCERGSQERPPPQTSQFLRTWALIAWAKRAPTSGVRENEARTRKPFGSVSERAASPAAVDGRDHREDGPPRLDEEIALRRGGFLTPDTSPAVHSRNSRAHIGRNLQPGYLPNSQNGRGMFRFLLSIPLCPDFELLRKNIQNPILPHIGGAYPDHHMAQEPRPAGAIPRKRSPLSRSSFSRGQRLSRSSFSRGQRLSWSQRSEVGGCLGWSSTSS